MSDKAHAPSPWENPEYYEKLEAPTAGSQGQRSLQEYIELQLSSSGFAVDQHPEGILAWPRGGDPSVTYYVIGEKGDTFVVKEAKGAFNRVKTRKAMNLYLKQWGLMFNMGARTV